MTTWLMDSNATTELRELPEDIQALLLAAESVGFSNFWYNQDYGLFADAPRVHVEDDRIPITWDILRDYGD